jgi:hypothetical protein
VDRNFYRFRSEWNMTAAPDDVYRALVEIEDYPSWWQEVRTVDPVSQDLWQLTCRSVLPYDLNFTSHQSRRDRKAGILEAHLEGDLEGFSRWTIMPAADGTLAVFDEEVIANKSLLRRLALVARPAFTANHSLMMLHGRRGLTAYLAGMRLGSRPDNER